MNKTKPNQMKTLEKTQTARTPGPSFDVGPGEIQIIKRIAIRACSLAKAEGIRYGIQDATMDLVACHANGNPLLLCKLLAADDGNFGHDVFGIRRFLDRNTGQLTQCFSPRTSSPAIAKAEGR